MTLWHYTCDHGFDAIGDHGYVLPVADLRPRHYRLQQLPQAHFSWFTDLAVPQQHALGLTSYTLGCDRTRYRYRVTDPENLWRWTYARRQLGPAPWIADLEEAPGAEPDHWWIADLPVPVIYDPILEHSA